MSFPFRTAAAALLCMVAGAAAAGECPADRRIAGSNLPVQTQPSGVTDQVLASVDLRQAPYNTDGRLLRLRELVVQPGGIVPFHSHSERPAIIHILDGEITEYATTCAVPILHKAGETTTEMHPTQHWWRNNGTRPARLFSADFFPVHDDAHMM